MPEGGVFTNLPPEGAVPNKTLSEVAAEYRVSRWTILRRLKEHPEVRVLRPGGRIIVFDPPAIAALEKVFRACQSNSTHPELDAAILTGSPASRSTADALKSLRRRQTKRLLAAGRANSSAGSQPKIVPIGRAKR
jgi:hypothetical protein